MGGLNVANPMVMAGIAYTTSRKAKDILVQAIKVYDTLGIETHADVLHVVKMEARKRREESIV